LFNGALGTTRPTPKPTEFTAAKVSVGAAPCGSVSAETTAGATRRRARHSAGGLKRGQSLGLGLIGAPALLTANHNP
jgi:hypothetical protein